MLCPPIIADFVLFYYERDPSLLTLSDNNQAIVSRSTLLKDI